MALAISHRRIPQTNGSVSYTHLDVYKRQLRTNGGRVDAVAVRSPHILNSKGATYAQSADWGVEEAEGFIKLFGMSSTLWAEAVSYTHLDVYKRQSQPRPKRRLRKSQRR